MMDQVFFAGALIGLDFSRYRSNEEMGRGGTGVFFRAHDEPVDREVAIEVLPSGTRYAAQLGSTFDLEYCFTVSGRSC